MKLFGTSLLALIACGVATASVSSGELTASDDLPVVVASLIIVSSDEAYPLPLGGMARSLRIGSEERSVVAPESDADISDADKSASMVPAMAPVLPDQRLEQVASLDELATFFQRRVTGQLSAVPVPTPRPDDLSVAAPGDRPATVRARPVVRQAVQPTPRALQRNTVRVANAADAPRKRTLRTNPIFIGMYR